MASTLDTNKLATMLASKRESRGLREIAKEIGDVSPSTLSRIQQGNLPDIETFIKICNWLKVSPDFFIAKSSKETDTPKENIIAFLRADRALPKSTSEALIQMINLAYESASNKGKK
ncbi:MAG: helix-turn-helix transcriptional regulator [Chitinophagales bacterium]|nr:helix-turn-helix transcriptional regulator [Chitinophagales bacterium]